MLKGQKKHIDKEQGKTKHEAPRSVNYRATQNKNNIGTTALERSVVYTTGGFKGLSLYKLHPESRYETLPTTDGRDDDSARRAAVHQPGGSFTS